MIKQLFAAAALAGLATGACAADTFSTPAAGAQATSLYGGLDYGSSDLGGGRPHRPSYGGFLGYNLSSTFAVEGGFHRLYNADVWGAHEQANAASLSMIASLPLAQGLSVYGRAGVNRMYLNGSYLAPAGQGGYQVYSAKDQMTRVLLGVGAAYKLTDKVSARIEVQRPGLDVTNLSAGISYAF